VASSEEKLLEIGVPRHVIKEYGEYEKQNLLHRLRIDPWSCYDKDKGLTIKICDTISNNLNIHNNVMRCKGYLRYVLECIAENGHCYGRSKQVLDKLSDEAYFSNDVVRQATDELLDDKLMFVSPKNNYFLYKYFYAEKNFANMLIKKWRSNGNETGFICEYTEKLEMLNETQRAVVDAIENNYLIILTGLPGTGKTTTISAIVECYGEDNVVLLAPTGKAASRISELCGMKASTLHSYFFNPNEKINYIKEKIVIIDELSMLDVEIAGWIAEGIGEDCVLILVGDPNQLPSVGPGQVLQDILDSNARERYHLTRIMRQQPGSIIQSAHAIHAGKDLVAGSDKEVSIYCPDKWDLNEITYHICEDPEWRDAQFLSVLKDMGSRIINPAAQRIFRTIRPGNIFAMKDKVIHIKNNKDLGVYNGEMGEVGYMNDQYLEVEYRDKIIKYPKFLWWQLELAYCVTIHKAQGSEFDKVVLFISPSRITTRNIIYTGITRAKSKVLVIAPSMRVISDAISNIGSKRQTSMSYLIAKGATCED
jgi:exodeoxyribonuclease V alpha subunit